MMIANFLTPFSIANCQLPIADFVYGERHVCSLKAESGSFKRS